MATTKGTARKKYLSEEAATVCKECGKAYRMLGKHVLSHGLSPRDYKLKYGLPLSVGLVCQETFERFSSAKSAMMLADPNIQVRMRAANPPGLAMAGRKAAGALSADLPVRAEKYREQKRKAATEMWDARRQEIERMWMEGASYREICEKYNCHEATMRNHLRRWGLPKRKAVWTFANRLESRQFSIKKT